MRIRRGRKATGAAVVAMLATATVAAGCGSSSSGSSSSNSASGGSGSSNGTVNLKIGVPEGMTGNEAFAGVVEVNGMKLAANEINSGNSGVKVSLVIDDYQSEPAKGVQVVTKELADSSINAFAGITSGADAQAIKPVVKSDKRPFVLIQATGAPLTCDDPKMWDMAPTSDPGFKLFPAFLKKNNISSVGIMYDKQSVPQTAQNKTITGLLKQAGISIVADVATTTDQTDFSSAISSATRGNPGAVFVLGTSAAALMTRQLRLSHYNGEILGQSSMAGSTFTDSAGKAAAGSIFEGFWVPSLPVAKSYTQAYTAKYKKSPDYFSVNGYDAIKFLAAAAAKAKSSDPQKLQAAMKNYGSFKGALGTYTFGAKDRIPQLPYRLFKWAPSLKSASIIASQPPESAC